MPGATEAFTNAGTTIAISAGTPAAITVTGYAALTYTAIGEITDTGSIGRTYNIVNHSPVGSRGMVKLKGSFDDGTTTIQAAYVPGDAGHVLLETALDDDDFYSFKETYQDGTIKYFRAQVTSMPVNGGAIDSIVGTTIGLSIKSASIVTDLPS
jgi:hypothetical protein